MPTSNIANTLCKLINLGMNATGLSLRAITEEGSVVIRDVIIDIDKEISLYNANAPEKPFTSFPLEALTSASSFVCIHVVSGVICRIIEDSYELELP